MRHKTVELEIKAAGDAGQFTALASVFGNVDLVGDRMLPGSFTKTLAKWRDSGDPIPVVLSHQWDDPMAYVGKADPNDVNETADGLLVQGQLDTSTEVGAQVYKLMKDRVLKAWSFGYTVPEGGEEIKDGVNNVSEADLIEVGPTLKGANPEAQTLAVKAVNGTSDERLARLEKAVADLRTMLEPDEESSTPPKGKDVEDKEPEGSDPKASDPLKDEIDRLKIELSAGYP